FYVYQQVYPINGIAMTLALSGLPLFISKIVAEQPDIRSQKQVLRQLFPYVLWLAIACWAFIFFGSQVIAISMGDAALQPLM
ncbi:polysaccharide biosynthesis protein, partial [Enterococcus faecalis]